MSLLYELLYVDYTGKAANEMLLVRQSCCDTLVVWLMPQ